MKLIYQEYLTANKNCNIIFVSRKSRNILVKSVSFYLDQFQRYGVLKKFTTFRPPCIVVVVVVVVAAATTTTAAAVVVVICH